ncbi:phosphatidate cytidylyltransferase [Enterovibrio norvegicus]|uniref:phosphatidate cytidylyltransferase n=1 Tax=Enterovibrio norvegicus TaxID=188144 RepID=UPI00030691BC|nr:phosphatidate cytidylyltransferase [Enterovibrio norvegicus]MCC4796479.1 phosphatidate cytidylyltransferase [Enterovibrio norvegicus]OEF60440.1 phosphatidate cytidylyltransferase [Enterovibrio norvegicus]PMI26758.1 phosphatidate cytidylyltransferase [Enterovibrio norvegicus]PMI37377.1 phosphatidate cytidylyltransferase [Enterovibrio norvegicus]PMN52947.1 phosphatidate cytidylyltransferase [Enterovibrio norvegicus]
MTSILPHSQHVMVSVFAALVAGTAVYLWKSRTTPDGDFLELKLRIRSWWWMVGIIFVALFLPLQYTIVFFGFLSFMALKEFLSIVPIRLADRRVIFWAYLSIPLHYYWLSIEWYGMFIIFIPVYMFLYLPMVAVLIGDTNGFIRSAGVIHWSMMLTVFCLSHMAYLLVLPSKNPDAGSLGMLLFLLIFTQLNDVSQYVCGKSFGKRKIIPKVSPNKTWGGFIGGGITIVVLSYFAAPYLTPLTPLEGMVAGLIISLSGFIGDLVISSVKRDLKIKDTGHLIPGHGGILDRVDSLMFTAPLFFHYIYYLYY